MKLLSISAVLMVFVLGSLPTYTRAAEDANEISVADSKDPKKKKENVEDIKLDFQKLESKTVNPELSKDSLHQADADEAIKKADHEVLTRNIGQVQELEKCQKLPAKEKKECRKSIFKKAE